MSAPRPPKRSVTPKALDYWGATQTPVCCLAFVLPLLFAYEWGLWCYVADAGRVRNGADCWMRSFLSDLGWDMPWLLPALVLGALLGWQVYGKFPWKFRVDTLWGMFAESLLFAFLLIVIGQLQDLAFQQGMQSLQVAASTAAWGPSVISYLGAGIYEEVLFRLLALPLVYVILTGVRMGSRSAAACAIVLTSVLFAVAHHVGPGAEALNTFAFCFRIVAGAFFAGLFWLRGFGITVGCHAAYDILVGILLQPVPG